MLEQISETVRSASVPAAAANAGSPSNQQILDAAKAAYGQKQPAVDASVVAIVNLINTGSLATQITALDNADWGNAAGKSALFDPLFASPDVAGAQHAAAQGGAVAYSVGVFSNTLTGGGAGVISQIRGIPGPSAAMLKARLNIYQNSVVTTPGSNLQLGLWLKAPPALQGDILGLYISRIFNGVTVDLKIVLDPALAPLGFLVSTGACLQLPLGTSVFGGQLSAA